MTTTVKKAAVIGAGQMGSGIAQVLASSGINTLLFDSQGAALERGLKNIEKNLARQVEKQKLDQSTKEEILTRLAPAKALSELGGVDLVVEAVVEDFALKRELFLELSKVCSAECLIATNTSSISITKIAACCSNPARVLGLHFMNPVPVMPLVEVIRGLQTSDATYAAGLAIAQQLGKTAVTAAKDYPGFIVNRILMPLINEAFFALMEGVASAEEIDRAIKLGLNHPMGPLELADFVGLDTCLAICRVFQQELGEDKYRPCPLMVKYVEAGWLGKKSGRGVYPY